MINTGLLLFCVTLFAAATPTIAKLGTYGFRKPLAGRHPRTIELHASASEDTENSTLWMRIIVTLTVLLCALYIILSKHYEADGFWSDRHCARLLAKRLKRAVTSSRSQEHFRENVDTVAGRLALDNA